MVGNNLLETVMLNLTVVRVEIEYLFRKSASIEGLMAKAFLTPDGHSASGVGNDPIYIIGNLNCVRAPQIIVAVLNSGLESFFEQSSPRYHSVALIG